MPHDGDGVGDGDGEDVGIDVGYEDVGDDSATMTLTFMASAGLAMMPATAMRPMTVPLMVRMILFGYDDDAVVYGEGDGKADSIDA